MLDFFRVTPKKRKVKIGRKKSGIIYSNPSKGKRYFFYFGSGVVIFAFIYLIYLYLPLGTAVLNFNIKSKTDTLTQISDVYEQKINNVDEFSIVIPKISATSDIVKDVSPYNKKEYLKVLEKDVIAQAKGTNLPGEGMGTATYLFAHSTRQGINMVRKNSVFYLLDRMSEEDIIFIRFNGKIYKYKTYMKKVVNASEVNYINYKDSGKEIVILQTCWPIGTDWKRLLVFAERL